MNGSRIITITDMRRAGYCPSGIHLWFKSQGLDMRDFLQNGISVEAFTASGDGRALALVKRLEDAERG